MEENILEIVEKSCQIHRDVIAVKYLSHRDIVERATEICGMTFAKLLSFAE